MDYTAVRSALVCEEGIQIKLFFPEEQTDAFVVLFRGFPPGSEISAHHPTVRNLVHRGLCVAVPSYLGVRNSDGEFSYTAAKLAADVSVRVLERCQAVDLYTEKELSWNLSRLWFIGSSFGGTIALCTAPRYSIEGVLAISPVTDWNLPVGESHKELATFIDRVHPHTVRLAIHWFDTDAIQPSQRELHSCKVILAHGKHDSVVPFMHSKVLATYLSCPLFALDEQGHAGLSDVTDVMLDKLLSSHSLE